MFWGSEQPPTGRGRADRALMVRSVDEDFVEMVGWPAAEIVGRSLLELVSPVGAASLAACWRESEQLGMARCRVQIPAHEDPDRIGWYEVAMRTGGGATDLLFVDRTREMRALETMQHHEEELNGIAETVPLGIFRSTIEGELLYRNSKLDKVFGVEIGDVLPFDRAELLDGTPIDERFAARIEELADAIFDVRFAVDDDERRFLRLRVHGYEGADGGLEIVGSAEDVTREVERHARLEQEALTDSITGTGNRRALELRLEEMLGDRREQSGVAVFLCDLDGFKQVNDSLGHEAGDAVIAAVGERLQQASRQGDFVARLGGDEFVLVARDVGDYEQAMEFAERVLPRLRQPFDFEGGQIELSGSIGVAVAQPDSTVHSVLQMADHAMYEAKRSGRNQARPYQSPDETTSLSPLALRRDLRRALTTDGIDLAFQPIFPVDALDRPIGAEALLRWNHPVQGYIPPSTIIPVAEQSGLVRELGDWTVREAIKAGAGVNEGGGDISIAVNLSAIQLGRADLVESVAAALDFHGLEPNLLTFELTESYLIDQVDSARGTLDELDALGVKLAIDDFGTGYSPFEYLISLPICAIKIDHTFSRRLGGARAAAMLRGLATSCAELDMMVIVEGIETAEQLEAARSAGATHAQGYHLGRPVSFDGLGSDLRAGDVAA